MFVCLFYSTQAQETKTVRDLELWTELKISKEIIKDFEISASQHVRLNQNLGALNDYIAELGLFYTINKNFGIGANGRYTKNNKYSGLSENDYRYDFDFRYDAKINSKLKFYYRLKYQKEFYGSGVFNEYLHYYETTFRHRIKLGWEKNKKNKFYSTLEVFRLSKKSREPFYSKYRIFVGDDYVSKIGDFDFSFGIENQLNSENPYTFFICKLKYEFEL